MYHAELVKRTQRTTTLAVALAIITALQGVSMYFGLRDLLPARTAEGIVIPLVVGAGVAVGFGSSGTGCCRSCRSPIPRPAVRSACWRGRR